MLHFAQTATPTLYEEAVPVAVDIEKTTNIYTAGGWKAALAILATVYFVMLLLSIIAWWRMFKKADEPGWKAIIPFYNTYSSFKIAGRNGWWFLLLIVPFVNIFVSIMWAIDLAKHFGKSIVFAVFWLWLFPIVGCYIIGFGSSEYLGPKHD